MDEAELKKLWEGKSAELMAALKEKSKSKEYAKVLDEFVAAAPSGWVDTETVAVSCLVSVLLRDMSKIVEMRNIKLQRGLDSVFSEIIKKFESTIRQTTLGRHLKGEKPLFVSVASALRPDMESVLKKL
jgi:hypothetical protein